MISQNFSAVGFSNSTRNTTLLLLSAPTYVTDTCPSVRPDFLLLPPLARLVSGLLTKNTKATTATERAFTTRGPKELIFILFVFYLQHKCRTCQALLQTKFCCFLLC